MRLNPGPERAAACEALAAPDIVPDMTRLKHGVYLSPACAPIAAAWPGPAGTFPANVAG